MFENFCRNEKVLNIFRNMLKSDRMPHAIIIEGEDGLGKRTVANEFAKAVLCEESEEYCNTCRNCVLFDSHTHPDFFEILPSGKTNLIKIDDIHNLRKNVFIKPDRAKHKIFVIESAERMNTVSQNALLKVLEEPPQYAVFILLAESSEMLLQTIVSRCTCLRLTAPEISEGLKCLKSKYPESDLTALEGILSSTDGNIGKAISILDFAEGDNNIYFDSRMILENLSTHKSYEILKTVSKYGGDTKSFFSLLDLVSSTASVELRKISSGLASDFSLSRNQLIKLHEKIKYTKTLCYNKTADMMVITQFSASLFDI